MSRISFVVAVARNGVIGRNGGLPWHISTDLKRFKAITMGKPLIMGRKTWESLPKKPLPGRVNIVITRQKSFGAEGAIVVTDVPSALKAAGAAEEICVIGGGEIFDMFLPQTDRIYLTEVDLEVEGDTFFPPLIRRSGGKRRGRFIRKAPTTVQASSCGCLTGMPDPCTIE